MGKKLFSFLDEYHYGANYTDCETERTNNNSHNKESYMKEFKKIF